GIPFGLQRYRTRSRWRLLEGLRDRHEQRSGVGLLRVEPQPAHEDRPASLDGVVGVQLPRVRGILAEQLEVDLDATVRVHLPRRYLEAARTGQFHLAGARERQIEALLAHQLEIPVPEVLRKFGEILRDRLQARVGLLRSRG